MPRLVCISDTHSKLDQTKIPDGDVLVHAGDHTMSGSLVEIQAALRQIAQLPHACKVIIAGNHDWAFQRHPELARMMASAPGLIYLQDSEATVAGLRFYGSPWQPEFNNWAFNLSRGAALADVWSKIPGGLDVLVTHGPPFGLGDSVSRGSVLQVCLGDEDLMTAICRKRPRLHVCGHIHEGYGDREYLDTRFVNASILDGRYQPVNAPIVVDLEVQQ